MVGRDLDLVPDLKFDIVDRVYKVVGNSIVGSRVVGNIMGVRRDHPMFYMVDMVVSNSRVSG